MSEGLVEAIGLAVELGDRRVVDGVSVRAASGQIVAVVGPNGAGKTTLLRALAGLVASSGELRIAGADPRSASAQANARHRAYCAQKPASAWDYRVRDLGEIVFNMIDIGQMRKTRSDKREDFQDVFEFDSAFARDIPFAVPDPV